MTLVINYMIEFDAGNISYGVYSRKWKGTKSKFEGGVRVLHGDKHTVIDCKKSIYDDYSNIVETTYAEITL